MHSFKNRSGIISSLLDQNMRLKCNYFLLNILHFFVLFILVFYKTNDAFNQKIDEFIILDTVRFQ